MVRPHPLPGNTIYRYYPNQNHTTQLRHHTNTTYQAPTTLVVRQSTTSNSNTCPSSLSGGAIAGIVIGTIAGTLLIIWLIKSCYLPGAPGNPDPEGTGGAAPVVYSSTRTTPRRQRRSRSYRDGPDYVEYIEKSPVRVSRSRTRRGSVVSQVSRPERVYIS